MIVNLYSKKIKEAFLPHPLLPGHQSNLNETTREYKRIKHFKKLKTHQNDPRIMV